VYEFVELIYGIAIGPYNLDEDVLECVSMVHPLNATNYLLVVYSNIYSLIGLLSIFSLL